MSDEEIKRLVNWIREMAKAKGDELVRNAAKYGRAEVRIECPKNS